jgi:hypothetical protein
MVTLSEYHSTHLCRECYNKKMKKYYDENNIIIRKNSKNGKINILGYNKCGKDYIDDYYF